MPRMAQPETGIHVIVRDDDEPVSLLADAIADVRRAESPEIETLPESFGAPHTELILGVARFGEDMLLVLDLEAVLDRAFALQNTR
jgi:chemotaxis signal transduction protein